MQDKPMLEEILDLTDEEILAECRDDDEVDLADMAGAAIRIWEAARHRCRGNGGTDE